MDGSNAQGNVVRINPGCFSRAGVENEAGEVEIRLSRYGNWMVHIRRPGETEWRIACSGDMEGGVLAVDPALEETHFGPLRILRGPRRVLVGDQEPQLSRKEYELLLCLLADPYRVFTKEELLKSVWGHYGGQQTRTLTHHAGRLRRKLAAAGAEGFIVSRWGIGYRLCDGAPPTPTTTSPGAGVSGLAPAS